MKPVALLIHTPDLKKAIDWYCRAFPTAKRKVSDDGFHYLDIDGFLLEPVHSDNRVSHGKAGTVLYWWVSNLDAEISRFKKLGSTVYRGPMEIENGEGMCQVTDPFGNLIGLRGPYDKKEDA